MHSKLITPALLVGGAVLAGCNAPTPPPSPTDTVGRSDMASVCQSEAAARFQQPPGNIATENPERAGDILTVSGQFPRESANATFFTCTFSDDGEFIALNLG
jgi:hypothetical protein